MNAEESLEKSIEIYADKTNLRIDEYFDRTSLALTSLTKSVTKLTDTVVKSTENLARYEERQKMSDMRMQGLENLCTKQIDLAKKFEDKTNDKMDVVRKEVQQNSNVRKIGVWLTVVIVGTMVASGLLFGSITGKMYSHSAEPGTINGQK